MNSIENVESVHKWRQKKGNDIYKVKYHYIREFGVKSRDADKLKYQSIRSIVSYLFKNGYIDDTMKVSNELYTLTNG